MMNKPILRTLFTAILLDQTAITITFPLITLIFFDNQSRLFPESTPLAVRSFWYGLCVALPNFINLFFAPLLSALSDEFGRKRMLLLEILSAVFFTLAIGFGIYTGILTFVFLGFIIRGAFCRTNPTALAIIGDVVSSDKKILYMSYLQFAISVGAALGPFLSGYLAMRFFFNTLNFSFPFLIAALIALINTFFVAIFMRETLRQKLHPSFALRNLMAMKSIFLQRDVLAISCLLLLIQLSWSTYYQFMPPILKTLYQFSSYQLGIFMGSIAVWLALATSIGMKMLHRYLSTRQLILFSCYMIFMGFAMTLLVLKDMLPSIFIWIGMAPVAVGDVIAYSTLTGLYSNAVPHHSQGKVMGISFIVVAITWAATGFFGGILFGVSPLLPMMLALLGVISVLLLLHGKMSQAVEVRASIN